MEPEDSYTSYEVALTLYAINALVIEHTHKVQICGSDIAQESGGVLSLIVLIKMEQTSIYGIILSQSSQ